MGLKKSHYDKYMKSMMKNWRIMDFKEKKEPVTQLVFNINLRFTEEDKIQLTKLIDSYFRKRANVVNSSIENLSGALLWVYSRINCLFQHNQDWSQKSIAELLNIKPEIISNTARRIMRTLRIDYFDVRFAREDIAKEDPQNNFLMTQSGLILDQDIIKKINFINKLKQDITEDCNNGKNPNEKNIIRKELSDTKSSRTRNKKLNEFFK